MRSVRFATGLLLAATPALAQEGAAALRARACPDRPDSGFISGRIVSARTGLAIPGARVGAEWYELTLGSRTLRTTNREVNGAVDDSGRFSYCGLPRRAPVMLRIRSEGFRDIDAELRPTANGALDRTFRLADATQSRGNASIHVSVVDDSGKAVTNGRVTIRSLGQKAQIDSGEARLIGLPAGTWVVELQAIGYRPTLVLMDADSAAVTAAIVHMERVVQLLDAVQIIDKSTGADRKVLAAIGQRMLSASGTLILQSDLSLRNATLPSEAIHAARGFSYKSTTTYEARPFGKGGCRTTKSDTIRARGAKEVAVYLDGMRMPGGLQSVNDLVRHEDILAIEAYPDVISAPFLWRTNDACAVIAFWTKR